MTLGQRIQDLRTAHDLQQREVAKLAGITPAFLCDIERGRTNPSLDTCARLAVVFSLSLQDLMTGVNFNGARPQRRAAPEHHHHQPQQERTRRRVPRAQRALQQHHR